MNIRHSHKERVVALAGLVQAAHLVSTIARTGLVSQNSLDTSLNSIFVTNPERTIDVFGGTSGIALGVKIATDLVKQFNLAAHGDVIRYSLALIQLERKLAGYPESLRELGARVSLIDERRMLDVNQRPIIDLELVANLADLYQVVLGGFEPRINVLGRQNHLQNESNINKIRALLLAGLRSAVLWHQLGGRRWHLVLARKPIVTALSSLTYI
jgi:high frequency lysogenization protein